MTFCLLFISSNNGVFFWLNVVIIELLGKWDAILHFEQNLDTIPKSVVLCISMSYYINILQIIKIPDI